MADHRDVAGRSVPRQPRRAGRDAVRRPLSVRSRAVPLAALFTVIALAFAGIAAAGVIAGRWPIAVAAIVLAGWMASLAWSSFARARGSRRG